jgi:hypothetical protein
MNQNKSMPPINPKDKKPTVFEVIGSVLAAIFGIQKEWRRERDFTYGDPKTFIIAGIIIVGVILLVLFLIVKTVLFFAVR